MVSLWLYISKRGYIIFDRNWYILNCDLPSAAGNIKNAMASFTLQIISTWNSCSCPCENFYRRWMFPTPLPRVRQHTDHELCRLIYRQNVIALYCQPRCLQDMTLSIQIIHQIKCCLMPLLPIHHYIYILVVDVILCISFVLFCQANGTKRGERNEVLPL